MIIVPSPSTFSSARCWLLLLLIAMLTTAYKFNYEEVDRFSSTWRPWVSSGSWSAGNSWNPRYSRIPWTSSFAWWSVFCLTLCSFNSNLRNKFLIFSLTLFSNRPRRTRASRRTLRTWWPLLVDHLAGRARLSFSARSSSHSSWS